ncbi:MAG: hypothetical protein ACPGTU_17745 [Myxococcota bacterium]
MIVSNTPTSLRISTDDFGGEGWATVTVTNPDGSRGEIENGFHFWEDGTGMAGAIGYYQWIEPQGSYWSSTPSGWGGGFVTFIHPVDAHWWNLFTPTMDTCQDTSTFEYSGPDLTIYDLDERSLTLSNEASRGTVLTYVEDSLGFVNEEFSGSDFINNHFYRLDSFTGEGSFNGDVDDFVETPNTFRLATPNIGGSAPPNISRGQNFAWIPSGSDLIQIEMGMVNIAGDGYDQVVACIVTDDGSFTVPSSVWTSWPSSRQINVFVSLVNESRSQMAHNNSEARIGGTYTLYGAGFSL